jgi:lipid II:glycine glycyltransferase (peptidoglycan interpeptide bridge formation enzyme)
MGCYPLFACRDWSQLPADIEGLADRVVSVALVTDPFAAVSLPQLQATFPDVCFPYKEHYVTDLSLSLETSIDPHHRRNIRKAVTCMEVEIAPPSEALLEEWQRLYDNLIERHGIVGIARFSPQSFRRQFAVPGFTAFVATDASKILGMTLWYVQGDVAYYHLGAYSDEGYQRGASFAIFNTALSHLKSSGVSWAALGAGAGVNAGDSGLTRFKRGWSTGTQTAFFCGRILQPEAYESLSVNACDSSTYFPVYRRPAA